MTQATNTPSSPSATPAPNTQAPKDGRERWSVWMKELPRWNFKPEKPELDPPTPLINEKDLEEILATADAETAQSIRADIQFLEYEVLRLFRKRDHSAAKQQNMYRFYQILFLILAAIATTLGSLQALSLNANDRNWLALFAFLETMVALASVYLATISGREPPLTLWMMNRRRAEQLRREYFRFLMDLEPYNGRNKIQRRLLLSERAAEINRGVFPDESGIT